MRRRAFRDTGADTDERRNNCGAASRTTTAIRDIRGRPDPPGSRVTIFGSGEWPGCPQGVMLPHGRHVSVQEQSAGYSTRILVEPGAPL